MGGEMEWTNNRTRMAHLGALWVLEALTTSSVLRSMMGLGQPAKTRKVASARVRTSGSPAMANSWGCRAGRVLPCFMVWLGRSVMVLTVLRQTTAAGSWRS